MSQEISLEDLQAYAATSIDTQKLDEEIRDFPAFMQAATDLQTKSRAVLDSTKYEIANLRARLYLSIKETATKKGERVTENSIEASIITDEEFCTYEKARVKQESVYRESLALVENLRMRDSQLRQLVELFKASYWAISSETV